jgi:hypothetical protein
VREIPSEVSALAPFLHTYINSSTSAEVIYKELEDNSVFAIFPPNVALR